MPDANKPDKPAEKPSTIEAFLSESEQFVQSITDIIIKVSGDHDDALLVASHSESLREQFVKYTAFVRKEYAGGTVEARRLVDELMSVEAVSKLAQNGRNTFAKVAARGKFGEGVFAWLSSHMEEIKKLIGMILDLLNNDNARKWWPVISQIIDQLLNLLLPLFGGIIGKSRQKIKAELSAMEVQFWNEVAARTRAQNMSWRDLDDDES